MGLIVVDDSSRHIGSVPQPKCGKTAGYGIRMAGIDWLDWHDRYDDPHTGLPERLAVVQGFIRGVLERRPAGDLRVVSTCAGQGRDLLPVLAGHPRRDRVRARLIELDPRNAALARDLAREAGLDRVEVVTADASETNAYLGAVPADLVLMCGVFGNISDEDVATTVRLLPGFCTPEAVVVWTRGRRRRRDLTPAIRQWFDEAGFEERAFESPGHDSYSVGMHQLTGEPVPLQSGRRLFTFRRR
jgi:hypothetical protein